MSAPDRTVKSSPEVYAKETGERLRELRGSRSQEAFALAHGIGFTTYRRYETGEREAMPSWLLKVAVDENVSPTWLFTGARPKHAAQPVIDAQKEMIEDVALGNKSAANARADKARLLQALQKAQVAVALKADQADLNLERMQDCIQVLAQVAEKQGRKINPAKFARACVFLYEVSLQTGTVPPPKAVVRLLETIA